MRTVITAYTFNPALQQVTFTGLASISLSDLFLIVNATNNTTLYQANNPALGGTVSGNVLTLTCKRLSHMYGQAAFAVAELGIRSGRARAG